VDVTMPDPHKDRRARNLVLAGVLFFLVALFYAITIVKVGETQ